MLTQEDLEQIADVFGLTFVKKEEETFRVRDGSVGLDDMVYWHGEGGLEHTLVSNPDHFQNLKSFPDAYSIQKPVCYEGWIYKDYYEE